MKIKLTDGEVELPDKIYLDQLIKLDLSKLDEIEKMKDEDMKDIGKMKGLMIWFLDFFKVLEVKRRFSIQDFSEMYKSGKLQEWLKSLSSGFQTSN